MLLYIYTEKCSLLQFSHINIFEGCVEVICWWFAGNTWLSSLLHSGHFCHHIERTQWPKGLILWICVLLCFVLKCTWHTSPAHTYSPIWCLKRNTWLQSFLCYDDQVHIKRKTARCQICVWNQQSVCVDLDGFTNNYDRTKAVVMTYLIGCGKYPAVRLIVGKNTADNVTVPSLVKAQVESVLIFCNESANHFRASLLE